MCRIHARLLLLGRIKLDAESRDWRSASPGWTSPDNVLRCRNESCVTHGEGQKYLVRDFRVVDAVPPLLSCAYCGREVEALFVGDSDSRAYGRHDAPQARQIKSDDRVYFETDEQAFAYLLRLAERDLQYRGMRDDRVASFRWKQRAKQRAWRRPRRPEGPTKGWCGPHPSRGCRGLRRSHATDNG